MMPIQKTEWQKKKIAKDAVQRNRLIQAARGGDEEAMESLTLEDMDTYTSISRKIQKADIFSLVDTYFMPYGVECDQYSIIGEIKEIQKIKNAWHELKVLIEYWTVAASDKQPGFERNLKTK